MDVAKQCGTCTQCCKVLSITELGKPPGQWCPHCRLGVGCGTYDSRPGECRSFACLWLLDPTLPDGFRPDKTKVVLVTDRGGDRLVARCDPANPLAWRREPTYSALKQMAKMAFGNGRQVMAAAGHRLWVIAPNNEVDLGEVSPNSQITVEELPNGAVKAYVR